MSNTTTVSSLADLSVGDRIIITSVSGVRRGLRIDHLVQDLVASGPQFKLSEPNVLLQRRVVVTGGDATRGRIVRVAS
jgi:hypothetical protein